LLSRHDTVVALDHRLRGKGLSDGELGEVEKREADILNFDAVTSAAQDCDAIVHCAAMVGMHAYSKQPARMMDTEEVGLRNVCRAALEGSRRPVIYASSSAVYGTAGGPAPLREDQDVAPVSNYGIAKRFNEVYLASEFAERGLPSVALRIFNIYGPGQDDRLVIPRFIQKALRGDDLEIFGDGKQTRDFVYVGDVVTAVLGCLQRTVRYDVINVCSGEEVSVLDLAHMIVRLSGSASRVVCRERPAERETFEQARCFGSRERMRAIDGVGQPLPLEEGLKRTIAAFRPL